MPTPPNPSPLPTGSPESVTRVDWAHGVQVGSKPEADEPSLELLQAIAGQDSQTANHQLRTQALELAAILRDKQHLLEQRESEINARSAALENELRVARLRRQSRQEMIPSLETVREAPASNPTAGVVSSEQASLLQPSEGNLSLRRAGLSAKAGSTGTAGTVRGTEALPATKASSAKISAKSVVQAGIDLSKNTDELFAAVDDFVPPWRFRDASNSDANESGQMRGELDLPWGSDDSRNIQPPSVDSSDNAGIRLSAEDERLLQSGIDLSGTASGIGLDFQREYELVQAQRNQLQEREETLEHRARQLEQVQDEITVLHREALEMRLATEQLWEELVTALPREDLARSLNDLRARLADHYRLANDALTRRKEELISFRSQLNSQEQRIRQQRREIQLWADRRYDEIETRAARLMVRETELDKLEAELHRQSLRWQQQRDAYRREIERLSWQLRDQQHSVKS